MADKTRSLNVKNLVPGLVERGKIKIGRKGDTRKSQSGGTYQLPTKIDHFLITKMVRGDDNNYILDDVLHEKYGKNPKSLPIRLLYDDLDLNFQSRYAMYRGTAILCYGDGEHGNPLQADQTRGECACPCKFSDPKNTAKDKCKLNGSLSCIIDGAAVVGGIWKFRTTGYNSVVGIMSSLALIKRLTGGILAGVNLNLVINPKTVANPLTGKAQTIYVVSVEFPGSVLQLKSAGYDIALEYSKHDMRIGHVEEEAKRLIAPGENAGDFDQPAEDTVAEFYPDNQDETPDGEPVIRPEEPEIKKENPGIGDAPTLAKAGTQWTKSTEKNSAAKDSIVEKAAEKKRSKAAAKTTPTEKAATPPLSTGDNATPSTKEKTPKTPPEPKNNSTPVDLF